MKDIKLFKNKIDNTILVVNLYILTCKLSIKFTINSNVHVILLN